VVVHSFFALKHVIELIYANAMEHDQAKVDVASYNAKIHKRVLSIPDSQVSYRFALLQSIFAALFLKWSDIKVDIPKSSQHSQEDFICGFITAKSILDLLQMSIDRMGELALETVGEKLFQDFQTTIREANWRLGILGSLQISSVASSNDRKQVSCYLSRTSNWRFRVVL
jgi:hypothetical protein